MSALPTDPTELYDWASALAADAPIDTTADPDHPISDFGIGLLERTLTDRRDQLGVSVSKRLNFDAGEVDFDRLQDSMPNIMIDQQYTTGHGAVVTMALESEYDTLTQVDRNVGRGTTVPQMAPSINSTTRALVHLRADYTFTAYETFFDGAIFVRPK